MILAALALVTNLAAQPYWVMFTPKDVEVGIAMGEDPGARLLVLVPPAGCATGVSFYWGRYGELDKALRLLERSSVCALVQKRGEDANAKLLALRRSWQK